jgi:hypothetical protein
MRTFTLILCLLLVGCQKPSQESRSYPYDLEIRVKWVLDYNHKWSAYKLTEDQARIIVHIIEDYGWSQKKEIPTVLIDVSYAHFACESSFNPYDTDHPTWSQANRSWGIAQV